MTTTYPAKVDNNTSLPPAIDNFTPIGAAVINSLRDAIVEIEKELGVEPAGVYDSVATRLNILEGIVGNLQIIQLHNDLGGTLAAPLVIGIQGRPVSTMTPNVGDVLMWNGTAWIPTSMT